MSVAADFETLVQIITTKSVMIGGKSIPLATIFALLRNIPAIGAAYEKNKSVADAFRAIEPSLLPVVETIANAFFPGSGGAIELVALLLAKSHAMTPEEEKIWMDRQTSEH